MPYNAFEPSFSGSFKNFGEVRQIMDRVKCVVGIVDDLDLNTRIWSKSARATSVWRTRRL
jgi:hypothetical protein